MLNRMNLCDNLIRFNDSTSNLPHGHEQYRNNQGIYNKINITNYWANNYNFDQREIEWLINGINPMIFGFQEIMDENNNGLPPKSDTEWDQFWNQWTLRQVRIINWSVYGFYKSVINISTEYWQYLNRRGIRKDGNLALEFENMYRNKTKSYYPEFGYRTLNNGYDTFCKKLYRNSSGYKWNTFLFEIDVYKIDYDYNGDRKYVVFGKNNTKNGNGTIVKFYADKVILSIGPQQLQYLFPKIIPFENNAYAEWLINGVTYGGNYKISLIYDSSFWINYNLTQKIMTSMTDLEINSIYIEST